MERSSKQRVGVGLGAVSSVPSRSEVQASRPVESKSSVEQSVSKPEQGEAVKKVVEEPPVGPPSVTTAQEVPVKKATAQKDVAPEVESSASVQSPVPPVPGVTAEQVRAIVAQAVRPLTVKVDCIVSAVDELKTSVSKLALKSSDGGVSMSVLRDMQKDLSTLTRSVNESVTSSSALCTLLTSSMEKGSEARNVRRAVSPSRDVFVEQRESRKVRESSDHPRRRERSRGRSTEDKAREARRRERAKERERDKDKEPRRESKHRGSKSSGRVKFFG